MGRAVLLPKSKAEGCKPTFSLHRTSGSLLLLLLLRSVCIILANQENTKLVGIIVPQLIAIIGSGDIAILVIGIKTLKW